MNRLFNKLFKRLRNNESGAAIVEFAIVAVLFFMLIFGIIEFGWIFNGYITLTSAAQEGARAAIVMDVIDQGEVRSIVRQHAKIFKLEDGDIVITPLNPSPGEEVMVSVNGDLELLIAFPPLPGLIKLQTNATMRQEQ